MHTVARKYLEMLNTSLLTSKHNKIIPIFCFEELTKSTVAPLNKQINKMPISFKELLTPCIITEFQATKVLSAAILATIIDFLLLLFLFLTLQINLLCMLLLL